VIKIVVTAELPDALAQLFNQHIRDFDTRYAGCHFEILADAPGMSAAEMMEAMKVEPSLPFTTLIKRAKGEP
jgi:hypothetical protein